MNDENEYREDHGSDESKSDESGGQAAEGPVAEELLFLSPEDSEGEVVYDASGEVVTEPVVAEAPSREQAQKIKDLEEELESVRTERDDYKNRMLRTAADLDNMRKRTNREKEELRRFGIDKVVLELLPVIDNLERALEHSKKADADSTITDGVKMVHRQFLTALEKHGVKGFDSRGEPFDPTRHEAIQQVESTDHESGMVIDEYQKGYFLHERLIRPAMVSVAKRVEATENEASEDVEEVSGSEALESEVSDVDLTSEDSDATSESHED